MIFSSRESLMSSSISGSGDHQIRPHDPTWPRTAEELIRRVHLILGDTAVRVEHIGSTAVPALAGRPIPDIQVSVVDIQAKERFDRPLRDAGYIHFAFPELAVDDYLVYVPADGSNTEHIEVCEVDSFQERRHLAVRDYLRSHLDEALAYEAVKRQAAEMAGGRRELYSVGKNDFLHGLEQRALLWYDSHDPSEAT